MDNSTLSILQVMECLRSRWMDLLERNAFRIGISLGRQQRRRGWMDLRLLPSPDERRQRRGYLGHLVTSVVHACPPARPHGEEEGGGAEERWSDGQRRRGGMSYGPPRAGVAVSPYRAAVAAAEPATAVGNRRGAARRSRFRTGLAGWVGTTAGGAGRQGRDHA